MQTLSLILTIIFLLSCAYRYVYILIRLFTKKKQHRKGELHKYAVMIAARNEEQVIGQLIDSIRKQDYPSDMIDIYVVADNCTDRTAEVAREHGAAAFERHDLNEVGKGYALKFLTAQIGKTRPLSSYDAYFVFDADNLLHPHYITAMNDVFSEGHRIVMGYRSAKNFKDTWITAAYGIYFTYESECANRPRDLIGTSCMLNGTGHMVSGDIIEEWGGWKWTGITEDLECTSYLISEGERIAFCPDAVLYDEQPLKFTESVTQRTRWVSGYLASTKKFAKKFASRLFKKGGFAVYDFLMNLFPAVIIAVMIALDIIEFISLTVNGQSTWFIIQRFITNLPVTYIALYALGIIPLLLAWKSIKCSAGKKLLYSLGFPVFMYSYIIVYIIALFSKPKWKPMKHKSALNIEDVMK